jgi:hypothetical protein
MARTFIAESFGTAGVALPQDVFEAPENCREALLALEPSPDSMFWFEYNFLYVLAADGSAEKSALGDHSPAGYRQRERFYSISGEGRLRFAANVARYIIFLCESTGIVPADRCAEARGKLEAYKELDAFLDDIGG